MKKKAKKKKPNERILLLRALKQAELAAERGRLDMRTPAARERYALAQSITRATAIALIARNNAWLRELGAPAEEILSKKPTGWVLSPSSKAEDFTHPNADLLQLMLRQDMIHEPDLAEELPLFVKEPLNVRKKKKTQRREAADELRTFVVNHFKLEAARPGAHPGTMPERIAVTLLAFVVSDESEIGERVRGQMPAPRSPKRQAHWDATLARLTKRIDRAMGSSRTPDPEAIVRAGLDELGFSGRANTSLFEADATRERRSAKRAPPPSFH